MYKYVLLFSFSFAIIKKIYNICYWKSRYASYSGILRPKSYNLGRGHPDSESGHNSAWAMSLWKGLLEDTMKP
jgi:hypothetical protein